MVKSSVITLVTLAGSSTSCSFWVNKISPVDFSISTAEREVSARSTASARTGSTISSSAGRIHTHRFMFMPPVWFFAHYMRGGGGTVPEDFLLSSAENVIQ